MECVENLKNGAVDTLLISESFDEKKTEELEELANNYGTKVEIISVETEEGVQLKNLGKIAAVLRYETGT